MNILAVQLDIVWEDRAANYASVRRLLTEAGPAPGTLVVLPEMFATGFSMEVAATDEPDDGPTATFLSEIAREFDITLIGGRVCDGQNEAIVYSPDGERIARYAKLKPFLPGGEVYRLGESVVQFSSQGATVTPFICYDLRFPEVFRDAAARWQPEVYLVIASWPEARVHHWLRLLQARAIENQAFVVGVNRCGTDPHFTYPGRTVIIDYDGEFLADAGVSEGTVTAALDLAALRAYRTRLPFLAGMTR